MEQAIPDQDVDLLRLAAKAAGITIDFPCGMYDPMLVVKDEFGNYRWWNPLTDDGDALRLAVKLNLAVVLHPILNQALVRPYHTRDMDSECREDCEKHTDHFAATRRAIVRAAAEISKGMPQQQPAAECVLKDNYYKTQAEAEERGRADAEIGRQMEGGAA